MYKILKNIIEMDDYSVQKLSNQPPEPFEWNTVEGTELNVSDCIGGKGKIEEKGNTYQANRILPEGYTQVDYIESHGKEYIDTGVNADSNLRTVLDMAYTEPEAVNQNVGAINMGKGQVRYHILPQYEFFIIYIQNSNFINTISLDTNRHLYDIDVPNHIIKVDKNNYSLNTTSFNVELNFWLFGRNSDSTIYKSKNKLYKCRMYVSGVLVRDFIPCYRNSDNEVGLYDLVNGVFYTNQGTGAFTYGSVVTVPNTDFEIPIKVVTGDNVIKHVGKNEFYGGNINTIWYNSDSGKFTSSTTFKSFIMKVKPNTQYVISKKNASNRFAIVTSQSEPAVGNYYKRLVVGYNGSNTSYAFKTENDENYILFGVYNGTDETEIAKAIEEIQLEEGTTPTQYEPYRGEDYNLNLGSIELCKIGDYEDILFKNVVNDENYNVELEDGAWYKKGAIDKIVLDGSENWGSVAASGAVRFVCNSMFDTIIPESLSNVADILADKLVAVTANNTAVGINGIAVAGSGKFVIYYDSVKNYSPTQFREWLNDNNIVVYYAVATPIYEKITDPTLISQLEALNKAKWFKGVNHWWTETDNLDPVLAGTYKQSIQSETQNSIANLQVQANEQSISNTPDLVESEVEE